MLTPVYPISSFFSSAATTLPFLFYCLLFLRNALLDERKSRLPESRSTPGPAEMSTCVMSPVPSQHPAFGSPIVISPPKCKNSPENNNIPVVKLPSKEVSIKDISFPPCGDSFFDDTFSFSPSTSVKSPPAADNVNMLPTLTSPISTIERPTKRPSTNLSISNSGLPLLKHDLSRNSPSCVRLSNEQSKNFIKSPSTWSANNGKTKGKLTFKWKETWHITMSNADIVEPA